MSFLKKLIFHASQKLVLIGVVLGVFSWFLEAFIHSQFFSEQYPNFFDQLFFPDAHETWMRLSIITLFISFAFYAQRIIAALTKAETALSHAHMELNQIFETSADGMRLLDRDFNVLRVNKTFLTLSGLTREEVKGHKCYDIFSGHFCHTDGCPMVRILAGEKRIEYDELKIRQDGKKIPCIVTATPFCKGKDEIIGIVEDFKDISERQQAEEKLRQSHKQLRDLASHMEMVREEERKRMAREIHDELGQSLTALKMDIYWLQHNNPQLQQATRDKLCSMDRQLDNTVHTVQRLSSELRPGLLDDLGLSAAVEWQANIVRDRMGIDFDINSTPEDITLDDNACSIAVFRIFQETLTNIARHSQATHVTVRLNFDEDRITLTVHDNGLGITQQQLDDPKSLGIIGMRERIKSMGGTMTITGNPGSGTTVYLSIALTGDLRHD